MGLADILCMICNEQEIAALAVPLSVLQACQVFDCTAFTSVIEEETAVGVVTGVRCCLLLTGLCRHLRRHSAESTGASSWQRAKPGEPLASMIAASWWQALHSCKASVAA